MKNVAVIGAGTMGNGIAHTFAQYDYRVQLIDVSEKELAQALVTIAKNLDRMVAKEVISEQDKANTLANITTHTDLEEGVEYASLVVEAATERMDLKLQIFKNLDAFCPEDTILATNTSSISITKIASATTRPCDWHALYESRAFDEIGRNYFRLRYESGNSRYHYEDVRKTQ